MLERILFNYLSLMNLDEFNFYLDNKGEKVIIKIYLILFEVEKMVDYYVKKIIQLIFNCLKIVYVVRDGRDVFNFLFYYVSLFSKRKEKFIFI